MVNFYHQHSLGGVLFLGDCNARHCLWGDSICNPNGYLLLESLSAEDNILNNGEKTVLSSNGSSVIDLCIVSGRIATQVGFELTTDPNVELFTGAPQRGHIPLIVKCNLSRTREKANTKPWLQKADWEAWQNVLEKSSHASLEAVQCQRATDQWGSVLVDITEATRLAIPYKRSSRHSKPFWSEDPSQKKCGTQSSPEKNSSYCSNYSNGERLNNARNEFKSLLIANLSGLKIHLKKVRNSELSEKKSSTAPTTQMEKDLILREMSLRAFYLRNLRSGCEKLCLD